jgi:hypothetical protein
MTTLREAAQQALEALELEATSPPIPETAAAMAALRAALAQPVKAGMTRDDIILSGGEEVLRVTTQGEFIWHERADELIASGDYTQYPALRYVLKALRENERLREALKTYGQHRNNCAAVLGGYQCTCGFNQQEQPR